MIQVYKDVFVGDDQSFEKVKDKNDWAVVRACKEGSGGHRDVLGYKTQGAPRDKNYLFTERGNLLSLNLIDTHDPDFVPDELVEEVLKFIKTQRSKDKKVLIACNQGQSRAPSLALIYLYSEGKLPQHYSQAVRMFRKLYPKYDPSAGLHIFTRRKISQLKAK